MISLRSKRFRLVRSKEGPRTGFSFLAAPFSAHFVTLVPRSLQRNRTETLATLATQAY